MGMATFSLCSGIMAFSAEAFPLRNNKQNSSVHDHSVSAVSSMEPRSVGREEQKILMRGILAVYYSAEFIIGAIVVCILALNGACCLCPRQDRQRLMKLLEAQKNRRGAVHHGSKSLMAMSLASISLALVAAEQDTGKEKSEDASLEAKRALLASIYAGFWSVKIVMGCVIVLILGIQGACCLCPRSEQSRILALQASLKKIEMEKEASKKALAEKSS
jgi:hypothetical protein